MRFWLFVFHWLSELYLGLSRKDARYHIYLSGSIGEGINKNSCALSSIWEDSHSCPLPALMCCLHEHRATANANMTTGDLMLARPVLGWWSPRAQTLCWPVDKLAGCWGAGLCCLQPEVIWLGLNGCCWAARLQLLFPCLTSHTSQPPLHPPCL